MTDRVAHITLDPDFRIGEVDRRLFGTFVEHLGRCVYTGIFEPGHATATPDGFRADVLALTRELGATAVRYPGGNFVSGYRWEDGVGPVEDRPRRLDLAWRSLESNAFGLNEFMSWTRVADLDPVLAVNLGTRGVQEAADLVEYANHPGGTALSDLRRRHGAQDPYGIRMWCLGNEMDGPWQLGQKTAQEYGRLAAETAKAMRLVDPSIELVACGSSSHDMVTFGSWESTVLEHTYDSVDYISMHAYYEEIDGDLGSFLASSMDMDAFIGDVVATADAVKARLGSKKTMKISFDEWNVWSLSRFEGAGQLDWAPAPRLIEQEYDVADAVVVGSFLISLIRNADRVSIACQAQLVNVIAPIRSEPGGPAWRQTIFYPFAHAARLARGHALRIEPRGPSYQTAKYGAASLVDAVATYDEVTGDVAVFAVHRGTDGPTRLDVDLRSLPGHVVAEHLVLADDDLHATNTHAAQNRVTPRPGTGATLADGRLQVDLPPVSWNVLRLTASR